MKIVYISSSTIPSRAANSIHVMKMCQAFAKNGHEVVLLAPDRKQYTEPDVQDIYAYYGVEPCFELIKMHWLPVKGRGYFYGLITALKARKIKPDIVYCRNTVGGYFSAKLGLPVIIESHAPFEESGRISNWMFNGLIRSKYLQKLVVITHALKGHYLKRYPFIKVDIQVAPDSADPVLESAKPTNLEESPDRMQVGYVGHLFKGRGVEIIVALASISPWADFHLVGGMPADIARWQEGGQSSTQNIFFHGFVAPSQAEKLRIAFDVLLAPYQNSVAVMGGKGDTSRWMSPLKIFEYMAAKKPIISSDLPVLKEVLQHEHNALLCNPDDVVEWASALEKLRDNNALSQRIAERAYQDFLNNYTWVARAKRILGNVDASAGC